MDWRKFLPGWIAPEAWSFDFSGWFDDKDKGIRNSILWPIVLTGIVIIFLSYGR